jgi:hypothetical protein
VKRSDLHTYAVLSAIADGFGAFGILAQTYPRKVVLAAFRREDRARRTEYGVAEHLPWMTPKGKGALWSLCNPEEG